MQCNHNTSFLSFSRNKRKSGSDLSPYLVKIPCIVPTDVYRQVHDKGRETESYLLDTIVDRHNDRNE